MSLMPWLWTPRAQRLIHRHARRTTNVWDEPFATLAELEQAYAATGHRLLPAIRDFQDELAGVTYLDKGDWFVWGIERGSAAQFDDLEEGEELFEICGEYRTAVPSKYVIYPDGRIEDHGGLIAVHAKDLVERRALDDEPQGNIDCP